MMNMRVSIAEVTVDLPEGWFDVTDDLPESSPITLAKSEGVGAIQFSIAKYREGPQPVIDTADLQRLLLAFGDSRGLGSPASVSKGLGHNHFVSGDFGSTEEFVRVWYVSDGHDIALVTYVTQQPENKATIVELSDAQALIESLEF
jgi:hypothetical protein